MRQFVCSIGFVWSFFPFYLYRKFVGLLAKIIGYTFSMAYMLRIITLIERNREVQDIYKAKKEAEKGSLIGRVVGPYFK